MPDGAKRKRRQLNPVTHNVDKARQKWYAKFRSKRFNGRFGLNKGN